MKAILLSAGQGRRLLPLTRELPKCLLTVEGSRSILEHQLRTLARCGFRQALVVTGFGAEHVERAPMLDQLGIAVRTRFNPLYSLTDNLITTWLTIPEMDQDFALVNGDTLFESALLERLLDQAEGPVSIAVDHKRVYDDDDMKVQLDGMGRVRAIGKKLADPDGEAIGMSLFRGDGVAAFREALEEAVHHPESLRAWYPSVLAAMAATVPIRAVSIDGLWWREVDCHEDLLAVRREIANRRRPRQRGASAAQSV
jgi:choline kinase